MIHPEPKVYQVIYADPPWRYEGSARPSDAIEVRYPTMSLADIKALQVPADPGGCVLFMWTTAPKCEEGLEVMREWGFTYRSQAVWDKGRLGLGYWFRIQHEILLAGIMGTKMGPPPATERARSVFTYPYPGEHSRKPGAIRDLIASWYPEARKLEMFARESHRGWDAFGNDVAPTLFDQVPREIQINTREGAA